MQDGVRGDGDPLPIRGTPCDGRVADARASTAGDRAEGGTIPLPLLAHCGVATWAEFEREAPEVAKAAARLWPGLVALHRNESHPEDTAWFAISYLGTIRRDGAPRIHPFCPILADGRLFAAIPRSSPKGWDLRRDPRCVIHAMPGPDDDELCIRAIALEVSGDSSTRATIRAVVARTEVGGMIESVSHDPLFEFVLQQVDVARWVDIGRPGTHAIRRRWRAT
jgi:hypothetical protein